MTLCNDNGCTMNSPLSHNDKYVYRILDILDLQTQTSRVVEKCIYAVFTTSHVPNSLSPPAAPINTSEFRNQNVSFY